MKMLQLCSSNLGRKISGVTVKRDQLYRISKQVTVTEKAVSWWLVVQTAKKALHLLNLNSRGKKGKKQKNPNSTIVRFPSSRIYSRLRRQISSSLAILQLKLYNQGRCPLKRILSIPLSDFKRKVKGIFKQQTKLHLESSRKQDKQSDFFLIPCLIKRKKRSLHTCTHLLTACHNGQGSRLAEFWQ